MHARHTRRAVTRSWRRRARSTALLSSATAVSLLATLAQAPSPSADAVDEARPAWLSTAGITVNPPPATAGSLTPPSVPIGYIISGAALPQFDITTTATGQAEVAAYARYVQEKYGVVAPPTAFRAYALPRIAAMDLAEADRIAGELVASLRAGSTASAAADPIDLAAVRSRLTAALASAGTGTPGALIDAVTAALSGLDVVGQTTAAHDLVRISAAVADADAALDTIPTYLGRTDAPVEALTRALGPVVVPDPAYLLSQAKQTVAALDALARVDRLASDAGDAIDVNSLRDQATALLSRVDPPALDPQRTLAQVAAVIDGLDADGRLARASEDVAVALRNARQMIGSVTVDPPDQSDVYDAVAAVLETLEPTPVGELRARLASLVDEAQVRAEHATAEALVRVLTLLGSVPKDPDGLIDMVRHAVGPVAMDDPAYVVEQVRQTVAALDAMGRIDRLVRSVPLPREEELRATLARLVSTIPPVPSVDPASVLAQVTKLLTAQPALAGLSDEAAEAVEDPAHASPVGMDLLVDTYGSTTGDLLVLPVGASVDEVSAAFTNNALAMQMVLSTTPAGPTTGVLFAAAQPPPQQDPEWARRGGAGCMARKQNRTAWYDVCSFWWSLARDGFPDHETFDLEQYGTAKSKSVWTLDEFEVRQWPDKDSTKQNWIQWSPASDMDVGSCRSTTVGVNVAGAVIESQHNHCEQWDIDKGADGGRFANTWDGEVRRKERAVASSVATNVVNGKLPRNRIRFDYYAH